MINEKLNSIQKSVIVSAGIIFGSTVNAAVCMEPGKFDLGHAIKVSEIWEAVTTKASHEYSSIITCMAAPQDICQVLAPLNWHAAEDERVHYTWRIGKNQNEPTAITLHTVHVYSTNKDQKAPYDHEGWTTGFKEFPCNPA